VTRGWNAESGGAGKRRNNIRFAFGQRFATVVLLLSLVVGGMFADPLHSAERKAMLAPDEIARRFQASEPDLAGRIRDPRTTVDEIALPFLKPSQRFVEVITRTGRFPTKFPVLLDGDGAVFLGDRPEELQRVARTSGFKLDGPQEALAYVTMLLRLGQPYSRRLVILKRFSDVPLVTNPSAEERSRYEGLIAKYASRIAAPTVEEKNRSFEGSGYVVRAQALEQFKFIVQPNGEAEIVRVELESALPIDMQA
jgi:hypothetical protein